MSKFIKLERAFTITKSVDEEGTFEGYASVFGVEDHHGDTVVKGAFTAGIKKLAKEKRNIKMLWNHDRYQPIGKFTEAEEDDKGLYVRGQLVVGVQKADETHLLMKNDVVDSMSIGGYVVKEKWDNKTLKRELLEIELREISPVTFPALDSARITSVKSLGDEATIRDVEMCLRDAGFSKNDTNRLIAIIKAASGRDVRMAGLAEVRNAIQSLKE